MGDSANLSRYEAWFLRWMPWVVLALLVGFVGLNIARTEEDSWAGHARMWVLTALMTSTAVWFIGVFTGHAQPRSFHAFVFAYGFTFGAFALLVTPIVSSDEDGPHAGGAFYGAATHGTVGTSGTGPAAASPSDAVRPREGVLQLVRGCVRADPTQGTEAVSAVTRCPEYDTAVVSSGTVGAGTAGSMAGGPVAAAASHASAPMARQAVEVDRHYGWLISIGGATVRRYRPVFDGGSLHPDQATYAPRQYVEVHGGLTVPLFVVVLAYVGGAVSLSRRIPEYQRRTDESYGAIPHANEPKLAPFEAREHVVFQIMQLVSAPFLALATWYIVSPSTLASAAVLAFGTGFASEPILLMIRGMVEGIRPAATRPASPPASNPANPPPAGAPHGSAASGEEAVDGPQPASIVVEGLQQGSPSGAVG